MAILLSAVCHASYNALVKTSDHKVIFYWSIYASATAYLFLTAPFLPLSSLLLPHSFVYFLAFLSALFYTLYNLATGRAYSSTGGDLSLSYPLSTTSPLYLPILAYLLFGEVVSVMALVGIMVVFSGASLIQLRPGANRLFALRNALSDPSVSYALLAGFLYSFGAIADKKGVGDSNFYTFTQWVIFLMFALLSLAIAINREHRRNWSSAFRDAPARVAAGGFLLYASFFLFRYGLATSSVAQAASVRQASSLFAVLIGVRLLAEPYGRLRLAATAIIVAGIIFIKAG